MLFTIKHKRFSIVLSRLEDKRENRRSSFYVALLTLIDGWVIEVNDDWHLPKSMNGSFLLIFYSENESNKQTKILHVSFVHVQLDDCGREI